MKKAVYACGKVVTGATHGDAFGKLDESEKDGNDFLIGDYCEKTGRFIVDGSFFYTKKIILIRHGEPATPYDVDPDPSLSGNGEDQIDRVGKYLSETVGDFSDFHVFCSPYHRCVETMHRIDHIIHVNEKEEEIDEELIDESATDKIINHVLEKLPDKSLIISHCDFIKHMLRFIDKTFQGTIPIASVTLIFHNKLVYAGREILA